MREELQLNYKGRYTRDKSHIFLKFKVSLMDLS